MSNNESGRYVVKKIENAASRLFEPSGFFCGNEKANGFLWDPLVYVSSTVIAVIIVEDRVETSRPKLKTSQRDVTSRDP